MNKVVKKDKIPARPKVNTHKNDIAPNKIPKGGKPAVPRQKA